MTKYFIGSIAVLVVLFGVYEYSQNTRVSQSAGSVVGTTFNTAKVAQINMTPSSASATSSSILNGDASDRIVLDGFTSCTPAGNTFAQTAAGLANWTVQAATTTTANPANLTSATFAAINMNVSTSSTLDSYAATTTYTATNARRWNAGSYMTFTFNGTSSSAACTVGVHYIGS